MSEKWEVNLCTVNMGREFKEYFQIGDFVKIEVYPTTPFDEIEKSAHRIAALPELEANYKEAVEALSELYNAIDSCMDLTPDVMRNAEAALNKAEGK